VRVCAYYSWWSPSPRCLDGDRELGDHPTELVDDPTHLVSGLGDSPRLSDEESAHREHLILARIKGELYPCAGAPTRTSGEWRLSDTLAKHHDISFLFTLSIYFQAFQSLYLYS